MLTPSQVAVLKSRQETNNRASTLLSAAKELAVRFNSEGQGVLARLDRLKTRVQTEGVNPTTVEVLRHMLERGAAIRKSTRECNRALRVLQHKLKAPGALTDPHDKFVDAVLDRMLLQAERFKSFAEAKLRELAAIDAELADLLPPEGGQPTSVESAG
jgi:hypothetical protein